MGHESIQITLKDGTVHAYPSGTLVIDVVRAVARGVAKIAVAALVDEQQVDLSYPLHHSAKLSILTVKDAAALSIIRHSAAHLLAHAVTSLYPDAKVAIGPVIEDGFYYDFACESRFTEEDLATIMATMKKLVAEKIPIVRRQLSRDEALAFFSAKHQDYKVEIIADLPEDAVITVYEQGEFTDLCRGPHVPHTGFIKAFHLTKLAGAYWRGDANNAMLQRIYGTAWLSHIDLQAYLTRIKEAQKRDHRLLAKQEKMDLYHIAEDAPGMVFWHPNGWSIYQAVVADMRQRLQRYGYQEVHTPILGSERLWQLSGHAEKFGENMFFTECEEQQSRLAIKPMNCPFHVQIFNQGIKSYRDLPIRLAEFGCCHRNEPSGSLHGLMRVREFTQDDAHIFCTSEQVSAEVTQFIRQLYAVYEDYGFDDVLVKLSTRPAQRVGDDQLWDKAEESLKQSILSIGLDYEVCPGEGAFYGPKIEFSLRDSLARVWQCGTIQLDFFMPQRLGATYIDQEGEKQAPVMLHRAILGSLERFMAILLEHYSGNLPPWLAPIQVVVLNITDAQADYAKKITQMLENRGIRVNLDLRNEKIGFKIRTHTIARVPFLAIVGPEELNKQTVTVRTQSGENLGERGLEACLEDMDEWVKQVNGE